MNRETEGRKTSARIGASPVLIIWEDAAHQSGWLDGEEVEATDCEVETVGWLVRIDDQRLIIAQSLAEGCHAQTLQIPRGMVREVIYLERT